MRIDGQIRAHSKLKKTQLMDGITNCLLLVNDVSKCGTTMTWVFNVASKGIEC